MKKLYPLLCKQETLAEAWLSIAERQAAGGIDGTSVKAFAAKAPQYLEGLAADLQEGSYVPEPYLAVRLPKRKGGSRELGLPSVRDKIVQQAVKNLLEPILDPHFLDVSYAYRRNKSTYKAVQRVRHIIRTHKKKWVVKSDIHQFFDHLDHKIIFQQLKDIGVEAAIVHLVELWIGMARIGKDMKWKSVKKGIPQGNIISPLLSNLYLHPFDQLMCQHDWGYVRFADDYAILTRHKGEAERARQLQRKFLAEQLKLSINPDEQKIVEAGEGFDFLGVVIYEREVGLRPAKMERLQETLSRGLRLHGMRIDRTYYGKIKTLCAYYGKLLPQELLEKLDQQLSDTLIEALRLWLRRKQIRVESLKAPLLHGLPFFSTKYRNARNKSIKYILKQARVRPRPAPKRSKNATEAKIARKQHEYEQKAAEARELLITTPGVFLGKAYGQIVVKQQGRGIQRLPLKPLRNITIQSRGVSVSSDVLYECSKQGVSIDFLGFDGKPYGKFLADRTLDAKTGMAQLQAYENGKGWTLAKTFVEGKIRNQVNFIKYATKYAAEHTQSYQQWAVKSLGQMEGQLNQLQTLTRGKLSEKRNELMGLEARAALGYWQFIRRYLSQYVDFPGREHQGAQDPTNQALNYGYGVLYGRIWEAVIKARLHTGLSYLHSPGEGYKPSLIFDLIEEFRTQAVDRPIYALIRKSAVPQLKHGRLIEASRKRIARTVLSRLSKREKFRSRTMSLSEIILFQGRCLAGYLEGKLDRYRPYIRKW